MSAAWNFGATIGARRANARPRLVYAYPEWSRKFIVLLQTGPFRDRRESKRLQWTVDAGGPPSEVTTFTFASHPSTTPCSLVVMDRTGFRPDEENGCVVWWKLEAARHAWYVHDQRKSEETDLLLSSDVSVMAFEEIYRQLDSDIS